LSLAVQSKQCFCIIIIIIRYQPFDQVKKLGLSSQTEEIIRELDPFEIGMLQVETVLPKGPASGHLLEGDILISINKKIITKFVPLEEIIDNNVNQTLDFEIERACIKHIFKIKVQDLFEITPDRYVEISGAVVNNLSYQLARQYCVPVQGVYVCHPNGIFRFDGTTDSGWIIQSVNSIPIPTIDEFIKVFEKIPDKSRFPVTYYSIADQHSPQLKIVQVDYEWHEFRLAKRIDSQPKWEFKKLVKTPAIKSDSIVSATFPEYDESLGDSRIVLRSLVKVSMTMPMLIDGYPKHRKEGSGLVIDSKRGLVLVSRQIVPFSLGRVNLIFADSIVVEAKIIFLHPTQNVAVLSYDVNSIGTTPVLAASISDIKLSPGSKVKLVALNQVHRPVCIDTTVTDISPVTIPWNNVPRFRAINFQGITLETPLSQQCSSGVLTDNNGSVQGLWLSFLGETTYNGSHNQYHFGIHINPLLNTINQVINENKMLVGLAAEFTPLRLAACRELGLSQKWTEQVEKANQYNRTLFLVQRTESGTLTSKVLQDLDLIIKIDGNIITRLEDLELYPNTRKHLKVTLYRAKKEMTLIVPTSVLDGDNATMYILWCGALIQSNINLKRST
jgi:S1-C subfamily serine protease